MDTRALVGISAALGMAAGLAIGYAAFHGDSAKQAPSAAPVAAASSVATSASGSASSGFTLAGKLTLKFSYGAFVRDSDNRCAGSGGYSDIAEGAAVTITDQSGTVIATGQLDAGHADVEDGQSVDCAFSFSVLHVPDGKTFYGVTVSHRGAIQFSAERAKGGDVALSLGG